MASGRLPCFRQRSMQSRRASESGPPETARATLVAAAREAKSGSSSASLSGATASAAGTCLFDGNTLAERLRRVRVLLQDLEVGLAGRVALAEAGKREAELEERVR